MACAYAQLGEQADALRCLEAALDNNFEDYAGIRGDPDLAPIRGAELDKLLSRYVPTTLVLGPTQTLAR